MSYAVAVCVSPLCVSPMFLLCNTHFCVIQYHILSFCHFQKLSISLALLSVIRVSSAGAVLPHHVCCTQKLCVVHRSPPLSDKTQLLSFCAPHLITSGDIFSRVVLPNYVLLPMLPWTDKHNMNINERQVCKEQRSGATKKGRDHVISTLSTSYPCDWSRWTRRKKSRC